MATGFSIPSKKDRQRWFLWKMEKPFEEIAARERVSVDAVKKSVENVQIFHLSAQADQVDAAYNHLALELVPEQRKVLKEAMKATTIRTDTEGNEKTIADHATRLKALEVAKGFVETARPKAGPSVNIQNNLSANGASTSSGRISFEAILREHHREIEGNKLPGAEPKMLEAEVEDAEGFSRQEAVRQEFDEMGIDLDDDDFEEDEDGDNGDE